MHLIQFPTHRTAIWITTTMGYTHHLICTYVRVTTSHRIAFAAPDYRFLICAIGTTIIPTIEVTATENMNTFTTPNIYSAVFTNAVPTMPVTIMPNIKLLLLFFMCV